MNGPPAGGGRYGRAVTDATPALIALGGNLGDVPAAFAAALEALHAAPGIRVTAASRAYRTPAVGAAAGGDFLNAAATLATALPPHALLDELHRRETAAGRVREARWGPRPLDLDLILHGARRVDDGRLTVPHPALGWRRFVLDPAREVAADWPVPGGGRVVGLHAALLRRPLPVGVWTVDAGFYESLRTELEPAFPARLWQCRPGATARRRPPTLWLVPAGTAAPAGPRFARLPADPAAAVAAVRDILAAALPDPEPAPAGGPVWTATNPR